MGSVLLVNLNVPAALIRLLPVQPALILNTFTIWSPRNASSSVRERTLKVGPTVSAANCLVLPAIQLSIPVLAALEVFIFIMELALSNVQSAITPTQPHLNARNASFPVKSALKINASFASHFPTCIRSLACSVVLLTCHMNSLATALNALGLASALDALNLQQILRSVANVFTLTSCFKETV